MKNWAWLVIVILVAAALAAVRVRRVREKESAPLLAAATVAVDTRPVTRGRVARTRHILGTVIGADEVSVAPRVMAQVMEVKVREGDAVRRGQPLVVLDARELEDAVLQAEAAVEAARGGLSAAQTAFSAQRDATARDRRLFQATAISQEQWDWSQSKEAAAAAHLVAVKAQVEVAVRSLDQARTRLGYCRITAPLSGVVARRLADPGVLGVPGKSLLEIVSQKEIRVRAEVPSEDLPSLSVGQTVTLSLGDLRLETAISRVFPSMGPSRLATFEADVSSPPPGFVSGAAVGVDVHLSAAEGLTVPAGALLEGESGAWVFKVADGTVHPVEVSVVDRSLDAVVVSGDLSSGDRVIVARPSRLMTFADGMRVGVAHSAS